MVACSNKSKIDARLTDAQLAHAIRNVGKLPRDSCIRRRLAERNLPANMSGVIAWLIDSERAEILKSELRGEQ